jgi:hypothetical protein
MSVQIRIFMGYLLNKEIKIHLNQNPKWKEVKLLGEQRLTETHWQEKEYIGFFIPSLLTYQQLREKEREIKTELQIYCPKLNLDAHSVYLFSQLFLF